MVVCSVSVQDWAKTARNREDWPEYQWVHLLHNHCSLRIMTVYASWHTQLRLQRVLPHAVPSHRCTWLTPPLFHSCHWSVSQTCRVLYLECTVRAVKCCSTPVSSTPAGWQARSTGGSPLSLKETRYYYPNWCLILSRCFHCTFSPIG